jgi:hypothetical protein
MKPLLAVGLAATLIGCAGAESYNRYPDPVYGESAEPYYDRSPYYRQHEPQYEPRYHEPRYHEPRHHRHYGQSEYHGQSEYYHPPGRRAWNGCRRGYTVQNGVCKPDPGYY